MYAIYSSISYHTFVRGVMGVTKKLHHGATFDIFDIFVICHIFIYFISYICQGCHGCYQEAPPRRHLIPHRSHINTAHCIMEASTQENCSQTRNSKKLKDESLHIYTYSYICHERVAALYVACNMFEDTSYIADVSQESKQGHQTPQNISFDLSNYICH